MNEVFGNLGDLKSTLINNFTGVKDPVDLAKESYQFYAENSIKDEKSDGYIQFADFHKEFAAALLDENINFILCEAPRGSGKSSQVNAWLTWRCSNDPTLWSILVARTDDMSITQLNGVEAIIRSPEHQRIFGNLVPVRSRFEYRTPWNDQAKVLVRPKFSRFPTFLAVGTGSSIIEGKRSDILAVDDIIDLKSAMSPAQSQHISDWFWRMLLPTRQPNAKVVVIGTPMLKGDLYDEIKEKMRKNPRFKYIRCPAISYEEGDDGRLVEKSYWPERHSLEYLHQLEQEDYWMFRNQYMLERFDTTKALFKPEWLQYIWNKDIPKNLTIFQGIDPNSGKDDVISQDYLAMATVGVDGDGIAYLLDLLYTRGDVEKVTESIRANIMAWSPKMITVEIDGNQTHFKRYIEDKLKISLNPVSSKNIKKTERLMAMSNHFIAGRILIAGAPGADGEMGPLPSLVPFVDEWGSFPLAPHDDALDSANLALSPIIGLTAAPAMLTIRPGQVLEPQEGQDEVEPTDEEKTFQNLVNQYRRSRQRPNSFNKSLFGGNDYRVPKFMGTDQTRRLP